MEIAPHEDSGVDIMLDDIILYFKFDNFYHYYTDVVAKSRSLKSNCAFYAIF